MHPKNLYISPFYNGYKWLIMGKKTTEILFLIGYMIIFASLFLISLYDFSRDATIVDIGFDPKTTNIVMMALSFAGIMKTIYHLYIFERDE